MANKTSAMPCTATHHQSRFTSSYVWCARRHEHVSSGTGQPCREPRPYWALGMQLPGKDAELGHGCSFIFPPGPLLFCFTAFLTIKTTEFVANY